MAFKICLDFRLFPDNTQMPVTFNLGGFSFTNYNNGLAPAFVNISGSDKGLQFNNDGIEIKLPTSTTKVDLKIGQFGAPVTIAAISSTGVILASITTSSRNSYSTHLFNTRRKISTIKLTGGNNEGILAEVCATF